MDFKNIRSLHLRIVTWLAIAACLVVGSGCGGGGDETAAPDGPATVDTDTQDNAPGPAEERPSATLPPFESARSRQTDPELQSQPAGPTKTEAAADDASSPLNTALSDEELKRNGLRKITGNHLTIITDLPPQPAIEELPAVFDRAVPHWCRYFRVAPKKVATWQVVAYLMKDDKRFRELGLLPEAIPPFNNGYAMPRRLWFFEQKSDYYRRHLLLHEGTHAFMFKVFGTCGPSWYMEGIAELLATHRWHEETLAMGYYPKRRQEVPLLGRIRMVRDEVAAGRAKSFHSIMAYDGRAFFLDKIPYGWSWAVCAFLDGHPKYQARFRDLPQSIHEDLSTQFRQTMNDEWRELNDEWRVFIHSIVHGHDLSRTAIDFQEGKPLPAEGHTAEIAADQGWQSSSVRLEAGQTYLFSANGRYQIASEPEIWWCEPGGVTIRYFDHQPLGILLAAIRPDQLALDSKDNTQQESRFQPVAIGLSTAWRPTQSGTLYLRINESPAELADNAGTLSVQIRELEE